MKEITCSIVKIYGEIKNDGNEKKIVADISWNGKPARTEIRTIKSNGFYGNGITLDKEERHKLKSILEKMEVGQETENKKSPVDFNTIFTSASNIVEKRNMGYTTKNGFIILTRKRNI